MERGSGSELDELMNIEQTNKELIMMKSKTPPSEGLVEVMKLC